MCYSYFFYEQLKSESPIIRCIYIYCVCEIWHCANSWPALLTTANLLFESQMALPSWHPAQARSSTKGSAARCAGWTWWEKTSCEHTVAVRGLVDGAATLAATAATPVMTGSNTACTRHNTSRTAHSAVVCAARHLHATVTATGMSRSTRGSGPSSVTCAHASSGSHGTCSITAAPTLTSDTCSHRFTSGWQSFMGCESAAQWCPATDNCSSKCLQVTSQDVPLGLSID